MEKLCNAQCAFLQKTDAAWKTERKANRSSVASIHLSGRLLLDIVDLTLVIISLRRRSSNILFCWIIFSCTVESVAVSAEFRNKLRGLQACSWYPSFTYVSSPLVSVGPGQPNLTLDKLVHMEKVKSFIFCLNKSHMRWALFVLNQVVRWVKKKTTFILWTWKWYCFRLG